MTFASLGLIDPLLRTLESLGYTEPTPVQAQAIPAVLKGRDLMAAAQTGTGKTAGFALPVLQRLLHEGPQVSSNSIRALVLVPTRELAEQVHESFRAYGQNLPLRTYAVYGGVSINPQMMALRKGIDVLDAAARVDEVVLASGDGDFDLLLDRVRAGGAQATVYGAPGLTAHSLIRAATRYVPIEGKLLLR